ALALEVAVTRMETRGMERLAVRIGIATGLVVVGDLVGEGSAQEQAVTGETPNLAARLQALAEPGQIVLAGATRRLVGDLFRLTDLGPQALKGFAEPIEAFVVDGVAASRELLRGGAPRAHRPRRAGRGERPVARAPERGLGRRRPDRLCSRARPVSASRGSPLSSPPRSRASPTRGCAINARPITATA